MKGPAHDRFIDVDITVPDLQVETAVRVGADPCFVMNTRSLATKIGKGNQVAGLAFLTLGESNLVQDSHLPTITKFSNVVYTKVPMFTRENQLPVISHQLSVISIERLVAP